ncbi:hypothetical protein PCANC_01783 [Puccinia coronata f. sp. avenae]|uniref:Secreted protein n=1 Tax=Puccinia coronata f. sp. avenae TaxID=200324 RepID=A0A2N5U2B1_9BASI|nr:hypothetical protein PCANC_24464 [Puccinia coronata f. sp. avenae]PLW19635.1 hypothetical protein PCASD_18198 [Puccinia coronata f. sp. avenae]PLW31838.1 hypothetical protein PCASD_15437 [Puccinia coronata f. sp. avenae]PLW57441.1 hypothetical protein PCANC_01783 [Puccinia coronata f. sp. avenae]
MKSSSLIYFKPSSLLLVVFALSEVALQQVSALSCDPNSGFRFKICTTGFPGSNHGVAVDPSQGTGAPGDGKFLCRNSPNTFGMCCTTGAQDRTNPPNTNNPSACVTAPGKT